MDALVTGATGLLGNNIVRQMLDRNMTVRVLVRSTRDKRPLEGLNVEIVEGDICSEESVQKACQGIPLLIHAAADVRIGRSGREEMKKINVEGTHNVVKAALAHGMRMVYVSSVDTLGWGTLKEPAHEESPPGDDLKCSYIISKREAESLVLYHSTLGLNAVVVNPAFMLGPWDWKPSSGRMLLEVGRGMGLFAPPGGNDFCDVRDVASGVLAAADRGTAGKRYILGGKGLSYYDAWTTFARIVGSTPPLMVAWKWPMGLTGSLGSLWGKIRRREPDINIASVRMAMMPHHFTHQRATEELDYRPRPLEESVEAAWTWFKAHGYC